MKIKKPTDKLLLIKEKKTGGNGYSVDLRESSYYTRNKYIYERHHLYQTPGMLAGAHTHTAHFN